MTIRTSLILRGFIFHKFSILINMMAFVALIYFSFFIMLVMIEHGLGSIWFIENAVIDKPHIFLGISGDK